jgi:hypothetical protein
MVLLATKTVPLRQRKALRACSHLPWTKLRSDLVVAISAKPQAEQRHVEDFAIELRSTMARK